MEYQHHLPNIKVAIQRRYFLAEILVSIIFEQRIERISVTKINRPDICLTGFEMTGVFYKGMTNLQKQIINLIYKPTKKKVLMEWGFI